jgi:hypothetical protein
LNPTLQKFSPAVPRKVLRPLAGIIWGLVGIMLLVRTTIWLLTNPLQPSLIALAVGLAMAAFMLPKVFRKIALKNIARLAERPDPACVFSVYPRRSWLLVALMFIGGITIRHSPIPRPYLRAPYFAMGICLLGGAMVYLRAARR